MLNLFKSIHIQQVAFGFEILNTLCGIVLQSNEVGMFLGKEITFCTIRQRVAIYLNIFLSTDGL